MNSNNLPGAADVVVIGGGIIGASTAYYLARSGVSVVLCEKGRIAGEQSSRNWGFIRKQGRDPLELPLMIESDRLWAGLEEELEADLGYFRGGTLYLSDTDDSYQSNLSWLELGRSHDLDTRHLSAKELSKLLPDYRNETRGALYTQSDARAEPALAASAIATGAARAGAQVFENCAARGLDIEAGRVSGVVTEHGVIDCSCAVLAGGAWSSYFCRNLELKFPQLKVRASVMTTEPCRSVGEASIWSHGLGMRRRRDGGYTVAFGGSFDCDIGPDHIRYFRQYLDTLRASKEAVSLHLGKPFFDELCWPSRWALDEKTVFEKKRILDPEPNLRLLRRAHEKLEAVFPTLSGVGIDQRWAGMIDVTPDELPIISEVDTLQGLVLSTGYSGHGFGIGPGAGKVTAEVVTGKSPSVDLAAFGLSRLTG